MCGIFGIAKYKKRVESEELISCSQAMLHRGPDDGAYEIVNEESFSVAFAHRRLSILDLSPAGRQPMKSEDENFMIVLNGEIYNFKEIKKELQESGYKFKSNSDTEVVLYSFVEWGPSCVHKFIGMFAFAIYDKKNRKIYLFRDRPGVKPLYYYFDGDIFMFASELKPFFNVAEFRDKREINVDAAALYFVYNYIPGPYAIWKNANKLLPGHWLEFDVQKRKFEIRKYWDVYDFYNKPLEGPVDENEIIKELEKILISAFQYRLVSDVPVGVFLSGGIDSTLVTALLQRNMTEKLKTYTIGFYEDEVNEAPYAKKIAEYLGTDHTEHYCSINDALEIIPQLPYYYDEPFADTSMIPTTLVSKIARQHVTVILSADGGDEIFGGYDKYLWILNRKNKLIFLNKILRNAFSNALLDISIGLTRNFAYESRFAKRMRKLKQIAVRDFKPEYYLDIVSQNFKEFEIGKLFLNYNKSLPLTFFKSFDQLSHDDLLNRVMAIDYKTYMVDDILVKVDRATMSVSLEGREPLLDHRIIELMAKLPSNFKISNGKTTKYLMRKILNKHIPREFWERPKRGFGIPANKWFRNELKPLFEKYFFDKKRDDKEILNYNFIRKTIENYFKTKDEQANYLRFWSLLMWEMWHERWGK